MKIIWKYIFTNVKERKMRTAVMLLSILLSTTLLFVSFSIGASYESAQRKMARGMAGSATLSITAAEGTIRADILPNSASIRASVGILEGSALYHENGYYETVDLIAATILMVPLLTNLLSMGLERLYSIFLGNEGRLAARNMRENKNIVQNITLLFISISAVIAITVVGAFLQPMHSMTWFILLLAAVGVINNLLINYLQKRRSIAMYKSVGLSNRQNMKMTLVEGFSSGLAGAMIAVFVSYMEIQTIFLVAGPKISTVPELNANTFLSAGGMGILVTLLGSVVPIFKSRSMKLVEEIKFE